MKREMILSIIFLTAIIIAVSFDVQLVPMEALQIPERLIGQELYVCPAASRMWDSIATGMRPFVRYIVMGFFFAAIILMFNWGWALYQNLLTDKFKRESFKKPWQFTKFTFWAGVLVLILAATPNYFRRVHIDGVAGEWVLCENNSQGARAVRASAVHR